jgi:hypothetical protein
VEPQAQPYVPVVVVAVETLWSDDPDAVVSSNADVVNRLRSEALLEPGEICREALVGYYVDYYRAQVMSGGFSLFVWNTHWEDPPVGLVREGLAAIGAHRHRRAFEAGSNAVAGLGPERLAAFLAGEYVGPSNPDREALNAIDDAIWAASREESLPVLNSEWLRTRPGLVAEDAEGIRRLVERVAAYVPDRADRLARAGGGEPVHPRRPAP